MLINCTQRFHRKKEVERKIQFQTQTLLLNLIQLVSSKFLQKKWNFLCIIFSKVETGDFVILEGGNSSANEGMKASPLSNKNKDKWLNPDLEKCEESIASNPPGNPIKCGKKCAKMCIAASIYEIVFIFQLRRDSIPPPLHPPSCIVFLLSRTSA